MSRRLTLPLSLLSVVLLTGFSDCGLLVTRVEYPISPCPSKDFVLPKSASNERADATQRPFADKDGECRRLYSYVGRQSSSGSGERSGWHQSEVFARFVSKGDSCSLLLAVPLIGAKSEFRKKDAVFIADPLPKLFFDAQKFTIGEPKVEFIGDEDEAREWCRGLPFPEIGP
jgi:hypothetical protein